MKRSVLVGLAVAFAPLLVHCGSAIIDPQRPAPASGQAFSKNESKSPDRMMLRQAATPSPNALALVVGIEKYRRGLQDATGSTSDAKQFARIAQITLGIPSERIHLLLDDEATKSAIEAQVNEWLPRNAVRDAEVFVFFAGHGTPSMDPSNPERYLVPWEAEPKYITSQGIGLSRLVSALSKLKAAKVYAFLDSCFSGNGGRSVLAPGTKPVVLQGTQPKSVITKPAGTNTPLVIFSASGPDEITGTLPGSGGLFSHFLFRGLNGEADKNSDNVVDLAELVAYVTSRVESQARLENRDQRPTISTVATSAQNPSLAKLGIASSTPIDGDEKSVTPSNYPEPNANLNKKDSVQVRLTQLQAGWTLFASRNNQWENLCTAPCSGTVKRDEQLLVARGATRIPLGSAASEGSSPKMEIVSKGGSSVPWILVGAGAAAGIATIPMGVAFSDASYKGTGAREGTVVLGIAGGVSFLTGLIMWLTSSPDLALRQDISKLNRNLPNISW